MGIYTRFPSFWGFSSNPGHFKGFGAKTPFWPQRGREAVHGPVLTIDQNVTFFPRFTFYLTEKGPKTPALVDSWAKGPLRPAQRPKAARWARGPHGVVGAPLGARGPTLREWLSQKLPSKRHVFSAIYLLFNRKTAKNPCIRGFGPRARSRLCLNYRSKRHVFSAIYLLFNRKWGKNPCLRAGAGPGPKGAVQASV